MAKLTIALCVENFSSVLSCMYRGTVNSKRDFGRKQIHFCLLKTIDQKWSISLNECVLTALRSVPYVFIGCAGTVYSATEHL